MWLIRSVDISGINEYINSDTTDTVSFSNFESTTDDIGIPVQKETTLTLGEIVESNRLAYDKYLKTKVVDYGYVVYFKGRSYLLDSNLYRDISNMYYNCPVPGSRRDKHRNREKPSTSMYPIDQQKYCTLYAVLSPRYSLMIDTLFPQYSHDVEFIKGELLAIHTALIDAYNSWSSLNKRAQTQPIAKKYADLWNIMIKKLPKTDKPESIVNTIAKFVANQDLAPVIYSIIYADTH
jgi:hypothetical protein